MKILGVNLRRALDLVINIAPTGIARSNNTTYSESVTGWCREEELSSNFRLYMWVLTSVETITSMIFTPNLKYNKTLVYPGNANNQSLPVQRSTGFEEENRVEQGPFPDLENTQGKEIIYRLMSFMLQYWLCFIIFYLIINVKEM
jgi:hypothetical protein